MLRWEYTVEAHYVLKISSQQITEFAFLHRTSLQDISVPFVKLEES
jgi:hypothetical protein